MNFIKENARWLATGLLLSLGSSFGQTFFISIFAGEIRLAYGLSDGEWGGIYTIVTMSSAFLLILFGGRADTVPLSRLAVVVAGVFALACVLMAFSASVWLLLLTVFLLRFCGQGMMTHMLATAMARWFVATRGRAMAITSLGFPASEALLPVIAILLISGIGWRATWVVAAAVIVLALIPALMFLLAQDRAPKGSNGGRGAPGLFGRHWTRGEVLSHPLFYAFVPLLLTPGFIGTVVFFHAVHVAEVKGWTLTAMAPSYAAYAAASVTTGLAAGWAADRFGPTRLMPVVLVPMGLGMFLIGPAETPLGWSVALALVGITQGIAAALSGTLLPTLFGTNHLGSVRSIATAIMVFSTAVGPGITGWYIDQGVSYPEQGVAQATWCIALSLILIPIMLWTERLQRQKAPG
ncbi:MFS transporter [Gymnodinialimonas ceratoperidinii]|uniref:MFS transporter n=1 Tax=Gymnodinialimonas ceratoperidinii TaxID=2856823 RepID=A0A8F6YD28_9RHOB|nr:MFS transporter [Gymnodinialimonas ceratoperidinii]QXT39970.1 MFS transporter [Gymnodinialimonas ceratoperidinii]